MISHQTAHALISTHGQDEGLARIFSTIEAELILVHETLDYWHGTSDCDCSSKLPTGACLRCDLDRVRSILSFPHPATGNPPPPIPNTKNPPLPTLT
jgi:hypothetical protein